MAVTSIWAVKGWLGRVVIYIENPDKTENPAYFAKRDMTAEQARGLADVIDYATRDSKTKSSDESAEVIRRFVTGVNCQAETAREEMLAVKRRYDKTEGIVCFHGYQAFAPGEATPEMAHEIGVKLAERLWGDRYQVIVATHLDKANLLHNHFALNNVSMTDGKKYYRSKQDYRDMARESDALCREYGLSVIAEPEQGAAKHYAEWKAEQDGNWTWRGMVRTDVDAAIRRSATERQFFQNLRAMGYEIKAGKDISVRPPGKNRFVRLRRNFGGEYAIEGIRRRILTQAVPGRKGGTPPKPPPKKTRAAGTIHTARRITGLRALYLHYLYRMGALPKKRKPSPKRVYFLFREDIRFIQTIARETRLLVKNGIDTDEQLAAHKESVTARIAALSDRRKRLRYQARKLQKDITTLSGDSPPGVKQRKAVREDEDNQSAPRDGEDKLAAVKAEIAALSAEISALRREAKLCDGIEKRSAEMREKLRAAREDEKLKRKEITKNEPFRGSR